MIALSSSGLGVYRRELFRRLDQSRFYFTRTRIRRVSISGLLLDLLAETLQGSAEVVDFAFSADQVRSSAAERAARQCTTGSDQLAFECHDAAPAASDFSRGQHRGIHRVRKDHSPKQEVEDRPVFRIRGYAL
jgi:hypothetical protein